MARVSLADIARSTGYSIPTVSRALRDCAEIQLSTRQKIRDVARKLNYRPNPILASLAKRHFDPEKDEGIPLAYFCLPEPADARPPVQKIIKAYQDYGSKLGYRIEAFPVTDFKDGAQATRILFSRAFQGIILPPRFRFDMLPGMDWDRFSVVGTGELVANPSPPLSLAASHTMLDNFQSVLSAWEESRKRGYRRIGFALFKVSPGFVNDQVRWGAAEACLREVPARNRIPTFVLKNDVDFLEPADLAQWVRLHRPDAVIGFNGYMRLALEHEGFRVPEDLGFASLHRETTSDLLEVVEDAESGMKNMRLEVVFAAIELLDQQIRHHQYGLLPRPRVQLVQSEWINGDSLPPKVAVEHAKAKAH